MKLALIRRLFSPTGGAELYLQRLLEALAAAGHELHLFTESWPEASGQIILHRQEMTGGRAERPRRFAQAVEREIGPGGFDCIFSFERTGRQDVYRAGDGVHRVWLQRRREFAPIWRRFWIGRSAFHRTMLALEARTFNPANTGCVIANSEMVKREIIAQFQYPAERILVVRNGVSVARFQRGDRAATRARFGIREDDYLLLFVGSGWERKGLPFLLEAMRDCQDRSPAWVAQFQEGQRLGRARSGRADHAGRPTPPSLAEELGRIRLLVVGKGTRPWRCPGNVLFAGAMAEVEHAYAAADLFVFLPIYEPSANVIAEARAAGLPVITSALNGASELIAEPVEGTVIPNPADRARLVRALGYWQARPGRVPAEDLDRLSLERNVHETLAILERAAQGKFR